MGPDRLSAPVVNKPRQIACMAGLSGHQPEHKAQNVVQFDRAKPA